MESDEEEEEELDRDGSDVLASIISTAVKSDGFFRHQQVGEGELVAEEKEKIVKELVQSKPALFLQRFGRFLSVVQLDYFESLRDDDFELSHYLKETKQLTCRKVRQQRVKNRRYAMLQRMLAASDPHFSEAAMRERNPLLYQQLVGKFMTAEEKAADEAVDMTNCSLSKIILEHMDINKERDDRKREEQEEQDEEFDTAACRRSSWSTWTSTRRETTGRGKRRRSRMRSLTLQPVEDHPGAHGHQQGERRQEEGREGG